MGKKLLIVESPAKAKTIQKYLGKGFEVASSFGHIADLPEDEMGIDLKHGFKPKYIITPDKKKVVQQLKKMAAASDLVYLASDEDREGEAIAWHLQNFLDLKDKSKRIVFHEITKKAITHAIKNPREIDLHLVNAQQARRILDRLVGYRLSPVLWKKIKKGLSAGRVQSVAVRLIVDREKEIKSFQRESFYRAEAHFKTGNGELFQAKYEEDFRNESQVESFLSDLVDSAFFVDKIQKKPGTRNAPPPFTTSSLQQEASRKFGFSVSKTMQIAQYLYENGYITYMRTDSVHLSDEAIAKAKEIITKQWGAQYARPKQYVTKSKAAQEAHEAIRPTDLALENPKLDRDAAKLYQLIRLRTLASQMTPAKIEYTLVDILSTKGNYVFKAKGEVIVFDGFLKLYQPAEEQLKKNTLPPLKEKEALELDRLTVAQKFTKPPARYTEATLVRKLEELGIGRPSTYAPTISTIQKRGYVVKKNIPAKSRQIKYYELKNGEIVSTTKKEKYGAEKAKLIPTDIGIIVTDFLTEHFSDIMDYHFTAQVEEKFDKIAAGEYDWKKVLQEFYDQFEPVVEQVEKFSKKVKGERFIGVDPESGKKVYAKMGPYGPMVQLGDNETGTKPQYASLLPGMSIMDITLDQALKLLKLPLELGHYEGEAVILGIGKYGPYIRYKNKFYSVPAHVDALNMNLENAVALIQSRQKDDEPVMYFEGEPVYILRGKYGPYIKWNMLNVRIPKGYNPAKLTEEEIVNLISDKLEKEKAAIIAEWPEEGYVVKKGGWGRLYAYGPGNKKKILPKNFDVKEITLEQIKKILQS